MRMWSTGGMRKEGNGCGGGWRGLKRVIFLEGKWGCCSFKGLEMRGMNKGRRGERIMEVEEGGNVVGCLMR